jgi:Tol biopolymer transport system component/DNA-binding winged helix-turn-helix (wHTH) protein
MGNKTKGLYEFGNFRLDAETDTLWQDDDLISLSPKAFELLKLLVINEGKIVSKTDIFETIWKDTFVEEGVLTQNIYTLRNALGKDENGDQIIENITRRGYRISTPVIFIESEKKSEEFKEGLEPDSSVKFTEEDNIADEPSSDHIKSPSKQKRILIGVVFGVFLISVIGIFLYNLPKQKTEKPVNTQNIILANLEFKRLTDKGDVNFLNISPDGNWLAYSNSDGIFLKDFKADSEVSLNVDGVEDFGFLQFSKDGTNLYFRSPKASFIPAKIYQTSRFGGSAKVIAENVWSGFSFSPDGKNMAFARVNPLENKHILITKNLETGKETELTTKTPPFEFYARNFPAWSSDGKKIVSVVINRTEHFAQLIVTDIETGKDEEIKTHNFQNVEQVVWAADGKAFIASASDGKNFQLWRISYPNGKVTRITNDLNDYLGISITSDGKKLLARQRKYFSNIWVGDGKNIENFKQLTQGFARNEGLKGLVWAGNEKIVYTANYDKIRDWNLWLIDTNDKSRQQLTSNAETQNEYPAISPDGNSIYYSSDSGELVKIKKISLSGGSPVQVTSGKNESELFPQISKNGDFLYYIKKGSNSSAVWQRSLANNKEEKITLENEVSPINFLSISPDGKYLAFQNLTKETGEESTKGFFQVCVISTDDPKEKNFYEITSSQPFAYFSNDGKALEFITNTPEGSDIWRLELEINSEPKSIFNLKNEWIFAFAWSKNGEKLALARGNLIRDAVLLTGFE